MIVVCVIQNPPRFRTEHSVRRRVTHRHFVTAWMAVKTPHEVNAKINLFSRKRDVEGAVPYSVAIVVMSHIPRTLFVHVI